MFNQNIIHKHLKKKSLLSLILVPFSLLWTIILILRRDWFHSHPGKRADIKIISVGNIIAGGSGKTPLTLFLANLLQQNGRKIAVSHRGYKGSYEFNTKIISDYSGLLPSSEKAGDEALLLAEKLPGIPICVGKNRWESIQLLIRNFPELEYIILDDSFQHLKVQHDLDLVIFKMPNPLGNGFVIPAGILREPVSALRDADMIIINGEGKLPKCFQKFNNIIRGDYRICGIYKNNQNLIGLEHLQDKRLGLISGIADPVSFENTLQKLNLSWVFHLKYPDHYKFNLDQDHLQIEKLIRDKQINYLITTEKDFTKLKHYRISVPFAVIRIEFELIDQYKLKIIKAIQFSNNID